FLVTSAEEFSLNEALRSADALAASVPELRISSIILNRAVTSKTKCVRCSQRAKMTAAAQKFIKKNFRKVPMRIAEDAGGPVLGVAALRAFGDEVFRGKATRKAKRVAGRKFPALASAEWPVADVPLVFTMGKGGVGKTTVSASLGFHQRAEQPLVSLTVCSTDPAPSLDDIFQANITGKPKAVFGDKKFSAI